jgi:phage/plasmid primase-like uncharacterized protein
MVRHYNPRSKTRSEHFIPVAELKRMAHGRWREILGAAGIPADALDGRRGRPCPKCGGRDRFAPMRDLAERGAVLCRHCHHARSNPRAGDGLATLRWWLGCGTAEAARWLASYLGVADGNHAPKIVQPAERPAVEAIKYGLSPRFELLADTTRRNMSPQSLQHVAALLELPAMALARLHVGWSPIYQATTWPMRDADGNVIGIRLRCPQTARKWALKHSKAGLFYDHHAMRSKVCRLWVCEGPTDCAALLSIEMDAVGVPSAGGAADLLVALARRVQPAEVVICADGDDAGRRGAERLRDALLIVAAVRIVSPPEGIKDARAWVLSGVSRQVIDHAADVAPVHRIGFQGGAS